jgi:hypothetical protein
VSKLLHCNGEHATGVRVLKKRDQPPPVCRGPRLNRNGDVSGVGSAEISAPHQGENSGHGHVRKGASSILALRHAGFRPVVGNSYVQKACALESAAGTSTRAVTWLPVREVWEIAIGSFGSRSSVNSRLYFAGVAADESESPVHHQL